MQNQSNIVTLECLPKYNLKVVKSNKFIVPDFLNSVKFKHNIQGLDLDVLLCTIHFYLNKKQSEKKIYFTTDDILELRRKKKTKNSKNSFGGYQSNMRNAVVKSFDYLQILGFIKIFQYKKYCFEAEINPIMLGYPRVKINSKLLQFDPLLKKWHKAFTYFIELNKKKQPGKKTEIQIKKFLNTIEVSKNLKKYEVRERFEEVLDDLVNKEIIQNWDYKKFDENLLLNKNWFQKWQLKSINIY